jgi:hypothetical protein
MVKSPCNGDIPARLGTPFDRAALDVLVDLSAEIVPLDPLLQAVWLWVLGETRIAVPEDLRFRLRAVYPEIAPDWKGSDKAAKKLFGLAEVPSPSRYVLTRDSRYHTREIKIDRQVVLILKSKRRFSSS